MVNFEWSKKSPIIPNEWYALSIWLVSVRIYIVCVDVLSAFSVFFLDHVYNHFSFLHIYGYFKYRQEVKRFAMEQKTRELNSTLWNSVSHSDWKLLKTYAHKRNFMKMIVFYSWHFEYEYAKFWWKEPKNKP